MYPTLLTLYMHLLYYYSMHLLYFHHTFSIALVCLVPIYNQVILQGEYINMDSEADAGSQEGQGEKKDDSPPWWKV